MSRPDAFTIPPARWHNLRARIIAWWSPTDRCFPWREDHAEWKLAVTEILLQRTRAESVASLFDDFFKRFPTPEILASASISEIQQTIHSLGLAWRAEYLSRLALELAMTNSELPASTEELMKLPGIGPYVAGAIQVLHRNNADTFVDANVVRLLGRYFGFEWNGETRRKKWFLRYVDCLFRHDYEPAHFGYALLDFTREVCAPSPNCAICPLKKNCTYFTNLSSL